MKIEYAFSPERENQKGIMTLTFNPNTNRFEGNWQTNADNGSVYKAGIYFVFNGSGEAS